MLVSSSCATTYKAKVKVEVYSLVSSTKRYSPDITQLSPGHRTCSYISHLNFPGSIQLGCHFPRTELFKQNSFHCCTRYPLTPGSRECMCGQSALPRNTTLEHNRTRRRSGFPTFISCQRQDANVLPKRRQSHQGDKLCDVSTVPLVARWPVFLARGSDADGEPHSAQPGIEPAISRLYI